MLVQDYNGPGRWSCEAIQTRYRELALRLRVPVPIDLQPLETTRGDRHWVYPVMDCVIEGIKQGDAACVELGVELFEEDRPMPFGRILKGNAARALRRAELTKAQKERVRKRVMEMLIAGHVPREFRQYARLARKVGLGDWWARTQARVNLDNPYVRRYYLYFQHHVIGDESSRVQRIVAPDRIDN
ncbi:hypothetical protein BH10PLA2_BH10PLA2_11380 [soil metagenome]